ncbi:MAG: hypothetical protein JNL38_18105 [Myxococcales bacterium]|nr:hypothetical protein [Myxococcales bacterium]
MRESIGGRGRIARAALVAISIAACGRTEARDDAPAATPAPEVDAPDLPLDAIPEGDCKKPPGGAPTLLFSAWTPDAAHRGGGLPGGRLLRVGKDVYTALLAPKGDERLTIYRGRAAPGATFEAYAKRVDEDTRMVMGDRLYWNARDASTSPLRLTFRGEGDAAIPVYGTENDFSHAVAGDTAYVFDIQHCVTAPCPAPERIASVNLRTGIENWSRPFDRHGWRPIVVGGDLFFTTNWDIATQTQRTRLFRMPTAGGDVVEIGIDLDPIDLDVSSVARDEDGLAIVGLGRRDETGAADVIRYRLPLPVDPAKPPFRLVLGRTFVGSTSAFDRSSVYFTVEGPPSAGKNQTQTLMRVCKDGTNPTVILQGVSINAAPAHLDAHHVTDLAVDGKRLFFTSNNAVYTLDK